MQNDVLKNEIAPWQEKGRWYKITLDNISGTLTYNSDESDIKGISLSSTGRFSGLYFKYVNMIIPSYIAVSGLAGSSANIPYNRVALRQVVSTRGLGMYLTDTSTQDIIDKIIIYVHGLLV